MSPGLARLPRSGKPVGGNPDGRVTEELPVGWGDTYIQSIAGQNFDITGVPNGTYYIEVAANPTGVLHETTASNDVSFRKIILGGAPGHRTVKVPPWRGIDPEPLISGRDVAAGRARLPTGAGPSQQRRRAPGPPGVPGGRPPGPALPGSLCAPLLEGVWVTAPGKAGALV